MTDLSVEGLTVSQAARRQRVVDAALELGSAGGYEAVQMRDVARTAGVALGTIYRYFTSKDHLLAAAMVDWSADLERRIAQRRPPNGSPADAGAGVIRKATRPTEGGHRLGAAVVSRWMTAARC